MCKGGLRGGILKESRGYIADTVVTDIAWLVVVVDMAVLNRELIDSGLVLD